jgi:hypothetical protein
MAALRAFGVDVDADVAQDVAAALAEHAVRRRDDAAEDVLVVRDRLDMPRVDARAIAAHEVIHHEVIHNALPSEEFEDEAVHWDALVAPRGTDVALRCEPAEPTPTTLDRIVLVDNDPVGDSRYVVAMQELPPTN